MDLLIFAAAVLASIQIISKLGLSSPANWPAGVVLSFLIYTFVVQLFSYIWKTFASIFSTPWPFIAIVVVVIGLVVLRIRNQRDDSL